jgi:hypothetical protein
VPTVNPGTLAAILVLLSLNAAAWLVVALVRFSVL